MLGQHPAAGAAGGQAELLRLLGAAPPGDAVAAGGVRFVAVSAAPPAGGPAAFAYAPYGAPQQDDRLTAWATGRSLAAPPPVALQLRGADAGGFGAVAAGGGAPLQTVLLRPQAPSGGPLLVTGAYGAPAAGAGSPQLLGGGAYGGSGSPSSLVAADFGPQAAAGLGNSGPQAPWLQGSAGMPQGQVLQLLNGQLCLPSESPSHGQ
jgi:hypothetical protein